MGIKVANNANATLAASINSSATSITVTSGQGARFPTLSAGDYFYATLIDVSNNLEIVKVTARSTDVLTIVRAQESTTARAYSTGDRIELRLTAATFVDATTIADDSIATAKIANSAITAVKMGSDAPLGVSDKTNSSTGYFDLPAGTTAQRPGSPGNGMIRYNTDSGKLEFYNASSATWSSVGGIAATGGTVTNVGGYTVHTFNSSGTFTVTTGSGTVELLVVAGGGQGGANDGTANESGGGGGAGGLVYVSAFPVAAGTYSITIGAGGSGATGPGDARNGVAGSDSVFGSFTATGGGYGGIELGGNGGSGGGSGRSNAVNSSSTQASTVNGYPTVGFGFGGGTAGGNLSRSAGGGGGAGAAGANAGSSQAGVGGVGKQYSTSGTATFYAGGGGGGGCGGVTRGLGGSGGGGAGGQDGTGTAGTANTGGGGGGSSAGNVRGGNGGSGVVILRYVP